MDTNNIHWMGNSAFRIEDSSMQIYIDPFKISMNIPKADVIFITHGHYDHYSPKDIDKIQKDGTIIIAPKTVTVQFKGKIIMVEPGQSYTIGKLKVTTVPAYNINKKFHPKENHWWDIL